MSKKKKPQQLKPTHQELVGYEFTNSKVAKVLGKERYNEAVESLSQGKESFKPTIQESVKAANKHNFEFFNNGEVVLFAAIALCCLSSIDMILMLPVQSLFHLSDDAAIVYAFILTFAIYVIGIPTLIWKGSREFFSVQPLPHVTRVAEVLKEISSIVDNLESLDVWKNKDEYPAIHRFDTKSLLQNATDLAYEVDYRVRNLGENVNECENYTKLCEMKKNLGETLDMMKSTQKKYDELRREKERVSKQIESEQKLAIASTRLENTFVVDKFSELVKDANAQNESAIYGLDKALETIDAHLPTTQLNKSRNVK